MVSRSSALQVVDLDQPGASTDAEQRILDAAVVLVARWGVTKTALGDIAKEAGCSRATLYRSFPGGKRHLLLAVADRELQAAIAALVDAVATADDLEDALTRALVVSARLLRDHDAAQFILEHEPGLLLPFLGFHQVDRLYRRTAQVFGPHLERFLPADRAEWAAEWTARVFISFIFNPHEDLDLISIDDARSLVEGFVIPAFVPMDCQPLSTTHLLHPPTT